MSKEERQTRKELNNLVYPNHLKYLKKLKADLKDYSKSDEEIRNKMNELNEKAKSEFK